MFDFGVAARGALREAVKKELSPYRYAHTLGVEDMAARLAALFCPEREGLLCAAALLHDITKEYDGERQREILAAHGITLRPDEAASPKIWHGITAPLVIAERFPAFAHPALLSAVRWHTTGHWGLTRTEALLYLADYIEEGREFADCVALRHLFFDAAPEKMSREARLCHLQRVLLASLELTLAELEKSGAPACLDSKAAAEFLKENIISPERM